MKTPTCPVHKVAMRPSRYNKGWYCPKKVDGQWCDGTEMALRYICNECGAHLHRPYCSGCQDPEMIVELRTNKPEPAPLGQDGLDEDYDGHR